MNSNSLSAFGAYRSASSSSKVKVLDICQLGEPFRTITKIEYSPFAMVANDQYMLIQNGPNICLLNAKMKVVREIEWIYEKISDLCWNTKLNRIYIISDYKVFTMNPETMNYHKILEEKYYQNCACSHDTLYLNIHPLQEVLVHSFSDLLWSKSVFMCRGDDLIDGMSYNAGKLALTMNSRHGTKPHVVILSTTTYDCLFEITITDAFGSQRCSISSLSSSGWLVNDSGTYNIHHLTENNILRMTPIYKYGHPYNVIRFGASYLAVSTKTNINLHKLKFVSVNDLTPSEVWTQVNVPPVKMRNFNLY
ncbi:unnamed protein product [Adineta steineri]|uniref:Uncharacterized protein n=1 Tax=Adineta steineri TaxID=433720 RepID=A0A814DQ21_9BILA|nr:unnamed protein product [Adineta steineri]CAF0957035.1 unnamed protein product [Adineta steineri]CAF0962082.1 unnamed protein product [Adineta steineri]